MSQRSSLYRGFIMKYSWGFFFVLRGRRQILYRGDLTTRRSLFSKSVKALLWLRWISGERIDLIAGADTVDSLLLSFLGRVWIWIKVWTIGLQWIVKFQVHLFIVLQHRVMQQNACCPLFWDEPRSLSAWGKKLLCGPELRQQGEQAVAGWLSVSTDIIFPITS